MVRQAVEGAPVSCSVPNVLVHPSKGRLRAEPRVLAMDRTNWDFGKNTINILMFSVIWNGTGIPLIWAVPIANQIRTHW